VLVAQRHDRLVGQRQLLLLDPTAQRRCEQRDIRSGIEVRVVHPDLVATNRLRPFQRDVGRGQRFVERPLPVEDVVAEGRQAERGADLGVIPSISNGSTSAFWMRSPAQRFRPYS
jgi:hypothetical protein